MYILLKNGKIKEINALTDKISSYLQECIDIHGLFYSFEAVNQYIQKLELANNYFEIYGVDKHCVLTDIKQGNKFIVTNKV